ncbi:MAG: hypothetical protein JWM00_628 [Candidatus Saccharibacteria bacterium]|nr:hypothetical protein [Candidatus Saccharibacteria bacterium]
MRYLVAVSGGVDSVVLLHKLVNEQTHNLIVAHFDHGIRPESDADARFVRGLARSYDLPFETERKELGKQASEALARERRYLFLRTIAMQHDATIVTAHHADDVIETIAINLMRGTGWRGLAVLDTLAIIRPLLGLSKDDIYDYALKHDLEWVEDETNATDAYLRNRLRRRLKTALSPTDRTTVLDLRQAQLGLKKDIIEESQRLLASQQPYSRYFFTHCDGEVAIELLRSVTKLGITRPQAERALHAIKTARAGTIVDIGTGIRFIFTSRHFTVQTP